MLNCFDQGANVSNFDVLDGSSLNVIESWSETPVLYYRYSISDTGIAAKDSYQKKLIYSEFGSKRWMPIVEGNGKRPNVPTLVSNNLIADDNQQFSLMSIDGRVLFTSHRILERDISSTASKLAVAQEGGFAAVALESIDVKWHLFTEASMRLLGVFAEVYDLTSKKSVARVEFTPLPTNDYDLGSVSRWISFGDSERL